MTHTHACACGSLVPCDGDLERNPDGWPETTCSSFHLPNRETAKVRCEACEELVDHCDDEAA